jgi:hypothetical protein
MRALQAWTTLAVLIGIAGNLCAQELQVPRPVTLKGIHDGERHPLAPDHRLDTITLGGTIRTEPRRPLFVVATKLVTVADGVSRETKWPIVVLAAGETSTIDKTKRREFIIAAGSPTAPTKTEAAPTAVQLEDGTRVEIRLLANGEDLITLDVTLEELTVRETDESVNVRDMTLAAPQQTARRVRSFRAAKLGSEIRIPLDGASTRDAKQVLVLEVTRK